MTSGIVFQSKVYHKIGISVSKQWVNGDQKIINFALNRIINMRNHFSRPVWIIWRLLTLSYFFFLMVSYYKLPVLYSIKITKQIYVWSSKLDKVDRKIIKHILDRIDA